MKIALWALAAVILAVQVLLPGFIGIANNGDFGKVSGWLCLAPRHADINFQYFEPEYIWSVRNYWDSPFHSSEAVLAWVATRMGGATHEGAVFDIRWLGAIHAALFLAAYGVLLAGLRGRRWAQAAVAVVPLAIFTDACYTAYLNSFYMDAVALCALLLMTAAAVWMAADERQRGAPLAVFTLAALGFVTSKAQHAIWVFLPVALLVAWGIQWKGRAWRARAWGAAALVLLSGGALLASTDACYRGQAMFNILFFRMAPAGVDLRPLGVRPEEMRYSGMHAYMDGSPASNRQWSEEFGRRTGFARLTAWYVQHPGRTLGYLAQTLKDGGTEIRPSNLGNFRPWDGHAPGEQTGRFALWSNFRRSLAVLWPWHLVAWYALFLGGCVASGSPLKWAAMGIAVLGAGEFAAAALADSLDAGRHMFLSDAATDLTVCFAAAWLARKATQKTIRQTP